MTKRSWILAGFAVLLLAGVAVYSYQRGTDTGATRTAMLALMPSDASYVVFADLAEIRNSPFVSDFYRWAPRPQIDPDYARFLRDTGFDYERDLDRVALAVSKHGTNATFFAVADGRFDQKMIAYAAQSGSRVNRDARQIFLVPSAGGPHQFSFTFLRANRIALSDDPKFAEILSAAKVADTSEDSRQWRERFERLAGSPIFAVIRQDTNVGNTLASQAPGGFQSPQLATLLNEMSWITVAGKPEADVLRVVAEGEYSDDRTARQLSDVLNGILVLAQAGLNGPDTRRQLDPNAREAYLEILRGADVSQIDRGETKSVRLMFAITPKLLDAAKLAGPIPQASSSAPADDHAKVTHATKPKRHARR